MMLKWKWRCYFSSQFEQWPRCAFWPNSRIVRTTSEKKEANPNNKEKEINANIFIFYTQMIKIWSLAIGKDVWSLNKRSLKAAEI